MAISDLGVHWYIYYQFTLYKLLLAHARYGDPSDWAKE